MSTVHDMHRWVCNPQWQTAHLEGLTNSGSKVTQYCWDTGKTIVFTKSPNRYPWDFNGYDNNFIYDTLTELSWSDPKQFKKNGWPILPRWWDDAHQGLAITNVHAPVESWQGCKLISSGTVSPTTVNIYGPAPYDFKGNMGVLSSIKYEYFWSTTNRETWQLTREHGRVRWQYDKLINGQWVMQQWSDHNNVVPGALTPDFPCYSIP